MKLLFFLLCMAALFPAAFSLFPNPFGPPDMASNLANSLGAVISETSDQNQASGSDSASAFPNADPLSAPVINVGMTVVNSKMQDIQTAAINEQTLERKLRGIMDRLNTLLTYFRKEGVIPEESSTEDGASGTSFTFGGNPTFTFPGQTITTLGNRIQNANDTTFKLKEAVEEFKLSLDTGIGGVVGGGDGNDGGDDSASTGGDGNTSTGGDDSASTGDESDVEVEEKYTEGENARFSDRNYVGFLDTAGPSEVSGMAFSRDHKDILYAVNDIKYECYIFVINATNGHVLHKIEVKEVGDCYDWEDLDVGPCKKGSTKNCIYIAESATNKYIYRVPEPEDLIKDKTITSDKKIPVSESDEMEAFSVSPDGDILIMSEENPTSFIFIEYGKEANKTRKCAKLETKYDGPTAATMSKDGRMMLVKVQEHVYYHYIPEGSSYKDVLCDDDKGININRHVLDYTAEYDGQSMAFSPDGLSYCTVSEDIHPALYCYYRLKAASP